MSHRGYTKLPVDRFPFKVAFGAKITPEERKELQEIITVKLNQLGTYLKNTYPTLIKQGYPLKVEEQ